MSGNFIVDVETTLTTSNETNVLYIVNSETNTNQVSGIMLIGTSLDNSANITFRVYVDPAVTSNGTSLIITSRNFADGNISSMNAYLNPVATSKGTKISTSSVSTSESILINTIGWYLLHGHSFLITAQVNNNNREIALGMSWSE